MAFNRKPEKQILQQHRFEEFNQNSISKLISLRSTTHWHVLAESEQLQKESRNNTLSGPLAIGLRWVGAPRPAGCRLMQDHFRNIDEDLLVSPYSSISALQGFSEEQGGPGISRAVGRVLMDNISRSQSPRGILNSSNLGETKAKKTCLCGRTHMCWGRETLGG